MINFLLVFVVIIGVLVFVGYINEKTIKLPTEIALLISSLFIGLAYIGVSNFINPNSTPTGFPLEYLSEYLVDGVLSFMLFSGACKITFKKLKNKLKIISILALITTGISTFLFGIVFYCLITMLGFNQFSFMECLLLGSIISPTDPIAATGILKKVGLSEELILTIEGESLFNDGVGIALFVAISGALGSTSNSINPISFFEVLLREILGAIVVSLVICFIMFYFFQHTSDKFRQIFISIFALTASYIVCQHLAFSAAISSVVCGIYFATVTISACEKRLADFTLYYDFWEVVDNLLNHALYIIIGIFSVNVYIYAGSNIVFIIGSIFAGIIARYIGVFIASLTTKNLPEKLSKTSFSNLLTWAGLKGGLSLALMIEASEYLSEKTFDSMIISVFSIVLFTTIVQGLTVEKYYKVHIKNNKVLQS